ncbi:MAG TPA: CpaD family pilus assembly lipoprotein [Kiloniellales bacterium]|nr:CpaD family pilus assembly lipoprotein [Kiloniellales bacterium]
MSALIRATLLLLVLPLMACEGVDGANVPGGLNAVRVDIPQPVMHEQLLTFQVNYDGGEVLPSAAEQARLADFLFARNVAPGEFISVTVSPAATAAITAGREQGLRSLLQRWGYQAGVNATQSRVGAGQSALLITHQLLTLEPEGCLGTSATALIAKPNELAMSRLGCATAHNLGVMVKDKRDLVAGGPMTGASDGERAAMLYDYYRTRPHVLESGEEALPGAFEPEGS